MKITDEMVTSINKAIMLGILADLCVLEIKDKSYQDLKQRLNKLGMAGKSIQQYFACHQNASPALQETFRKEFLSGKNVLISEILTLLTNMSEDGCEIVLNSIQEAIKNPEVNSGDLLTNH